MSVSMTVGQTRHLLSSTGPVHGTSVLAGTSVACFARHLSFILGGWRILMALQGVTMAPLVRLCKVCLSLLLVAFTCQRSVLGPQVRLSAADCTCLVLAGGGGARD